MQQARFTRCTGDCGRVRVLGCAASTTPDKVSRGNPRMRGLGCPGMQRRREARERVPLPPRGVHHWSSSSAPSAYTVSSMSPYPDARAVRHASERARRGKGRARHAGASVARRERTNGSYPKNVGNVGGGRLLSLGRVRAVPQDAARGRQQHKAVAGVQRRCGSGDCRQASTRIDKHRQGPMR